MRLQSSRSVGTCPDDASLPPQEPVPCVRFASGLKPSDTLERVPTGVWELLQGWTKLGGLSTRSLLVPRHRTIMMARITHYSNIVLCKTMPAW
jgi:hypothetical protein